MAKTKQDDIEPIFMVNVRMAREHNVHLIGACDDYDEYGDAPAGCLACGGDYPYCRQGCALFDDD